MSSSDDDSSSATYASCGATSRRINEGIKRSEQLSEKVQASMLKKDSSSSSSDDDEDLYTAPADNGGSFAASNGTAAPAPVATAPVATTPFALMRNIPGPGFPPSQVPPSRVNYFNSLQGFPHLTPLSTRGGSDVSTPFFVADPSINTSGRPSAPAVPTNNNNTTTPAAAVGTGAAAAPVRAGAHTSPNAFDTAVAAAAATGLPSTTANLNAKKRRSTKRKSTTTTTNKEKPTAKDAVNNKKDGATKTKKKKEPLPNALINMRAEHLKTKAGEQRFKIVDHYDPKSKQTWRIASEVFTGSDERQNKKVWKLEDLRSEQLRDLARNIGCAGSNISSGSKCLVMKEIAKKVEMGTAYANLQIPNPVSNAFQKKVNTMFRCINLMMSPGWNQRIRDLNDRIQRKDYVATGGSSPFKDFWVEFSEALNDAATQDIGTFIGVDTDEHGHIQEFIDAGYNLNDFNQVTASWCQSMVRNMFKARENIIVDGITKSGNHDTDLYNYLNKKFLSVNKKDTLPGDPVYYLHHRVKEQPGLDSKWTQVLKSSLTSNSTQSPDDDDADDGGNSKKDKFLKAFEETSNKMSEMQAQAAARHAEAQTAARARHEELMDLHKKDIERKKVLDKRNAELAEMDMERKVWDEYTQLMIKVDKLSKGGKSHLLIALSNRALKLEEQLGITEEESAMNDIIKNLDSSDEDGEDDG